MCAKKTDIDGEFPLDEDTDGGETDVSEGGSDGDIIKGETYASILKQLGVNIKNLSLNDLKEMIHQYSQEGFEKGNLIDFKTGKRVKSDSKKKSEGRVYQVKANESEPMTPAEMARKTQDDEYKKGSDKQNTPTVDQPFNPKPKAPQ